jgi:hypothetical protein
MTPAERFAAIASRSMSPDARAILTALDAERAKAHAYHTALAAIARRDDGESADIAIDVLIQEATDD